jgi:hypothetical protein
MFVALIRYPPANSVKPLTLDEDCDVIPLPDVEETIVPVPRVP